MPRVGRALVTGGAVVADGQPVLGVVRTDRKVLARDNPDWVGRVIIVTYAADGSEQRALSNTRQTREAAYQYLCDVARVKLSGRAARGRGRG